MDTNLREREGRGRVATDTNLQQREAAEGVKKEVTQINVSGSLSGTDTIYMSNNINPYTVMPLSPNQVNGQANTPTVRANFIVPFTTGNTIQVNGNMNIGGTVGSFTAFTFQYKNQSIYPYTIYDFTNSVFANASIVGNEPTFSIGFAANQGTVDYKSGGVIFNTENIGSYSMRLNGGLGINTDPGIYALNINGSAKVSGSLDIGSVTVTTLGIGTDVSAGYVFDVSGLAQFRNTITALQGITAQGTITANTLFAGRRLQTTLDANIGTSLLVNGTTQLTGNVGIGQAATSYALDVLGNTNVSNTMFANNASIRNNVDLSGNLFIANQIGNPSITGNVGIGTPAIAIQNDNNSLSVAGSINILQNSFLNQNLGVGVSPTFSFGTTSFYVNGNSILNQKVLLGASTHTFGSETLYVNGNSIMAGTFTVGSVPNNFASVFNGDVTVTGNLNQTGGSSQASADISGNLTVGGTSLLKGSVYMYSTLDVSGNVGVTSNLDVLGSASLSRNLDVSGTSLLKGNVGVSGTLDVSGTSLFTGNVGLSRNLDVSGTSLFTGNVGLSGNLDVSGTSLFTGNVGLSGNLDVSGTSLFTGDLGLSGTLDVSGTSLFTGDLGLSGNLDVSGTSLFTGDLGLSGNLDVSGTSLFTGDLGLSGTLDVSGSALITGNLNYNVVTERITYRPAPYNNGLSPTSPGYWALSGTLISLNMPIQPTMYIIDGSAGAGIDMSVNFVTPLSYTQPVGMTYTFVARNTTGAGHRLIYPYDTGVRSTTLIPTPISTTVVRIGQNNYSSTS